MKILTLNQYLAFAQRGTSSDVDSIMEQLTDNCGFALTRFVDYALSEVSSKEGVERIKFYLLNGTLIQRNYASLFFSRRNILEEWFLIKEAYNKGLLDEIQTFAR